MKAFFLALLTLSSAALAALPGSLQGNELASGRAVAVDLKAGKYSVVVFLSAHCPCSRGYEPVLRDLAKEFPEYKFVGVHSNADEPVAEAGRHFSEAALGFPILQDDAAKWADAFGALKTPHVYVVDSSGEVVYAGGVGDSRKAEHMKKAVLREALLALRSGKKPEQSNVRVLGCAIQRP